MYVICTLFLFDVHQGLTGFDPQIRTAGFGGGVFCEFSAGFLETILNSEALVPSKPVPKKTELNATQSQTLIPRESKHGIAKMGSGTFLQIGHIWVLPAALDAKRRDHIRCMAGNFQGIA
jgi:hypothetical protein